MANQHRGEIAVKYDGKEINLILSVNSICALEDRVDCGVQEFLASRFSDMDNVRMKDIRLLYWALMLQAIPDASLEDAGRLIDGLKGKQHAIMAEAIDRAFPDDDGEAGK